MQYISFGLGVADSNGKAMVKIGNGKAREIVFENQQECEDFYEEIVEMVKGCYRDRNPSSRPFGFNVAPSDEKELS
jgi:hypothetical protein